MVVKKHGLTPALLLNLETIDRKKGEKEKKRGKKEGIPFLPYSFWPSRERRRGKERG